jgi:hypothetical protein
MTQQQLNALEATIGTEQFAALKARMDAGETISTNGMDRIRAFLKELTKARGH